MNRYRKKKCNSSKLDNKVYKVTNTLDNMVYVGKTELTLNARWNQHIRDTRNNSSLTVHKHMMKVHKHMRKVGIEKFNIEVIEECPQTTRDEIKIREQYHMDLVDDKLLLNVNNAIKGHTNERSKQNLKKRKEYQQNWKRENKDRINEQRRVKYDYQKTWGGPQRYWDVCNLLSIDVALFE